MIFSRFTQFFKLKKNGQSNAMRVFIKNQAFVYLWSSRIRKSFQIYNFYMKKWQEQTFLSIIRNFRSYSHRKNFFPLISAAVLFTAEDWQNNKVSLNEEVQKYFNDFDSVHALRKCENNDFTKAASCLIKNAESINDEDLWEFYVQKGNMITWRREQRDGHYAYKVYVKYDDISAEDFLHVQMDLDYRREWDTTAVSLEVVDSDPVEDQQVIYWEMLWPRLFSNRDYVLVRKCFIDRKRNLVLICCKSTNHPQCPEQPHLQRVKDYWSYMVIKPATSFSQLGFEFVLTYFDDPGIKIPNYITNYVAQRQLPEFIEQLHKATLQFAEKKLQDSYKNRDPGFEYPADVRLDEFQSENEDMKDNVNEHKQSREAPSNDIEDDSIHKKSWWSYFVPFNYF